MMITVDYYLMVKDDLDFLSVIENVQVIFDDHNHFIFIKEKQQVHDDNRKNQFDLPRHVLFGI
jgi:hypothetical protein